jgi:Uma2 family endonuclease
MATVEQRRATIDDLYRTPEKAELIGGRIVTYMPTGFSPSRVASNIYVGLRQHEKATRLGFAVDDNLGYVVPELTSGRESFSPDASFYSGPLPANRMQFIAGTPTLAVEVRSENDYGPAAERAMAAKRADYFEAGTRVVWDVDPQARRIRAYRPEAPSNPTTFGPGEIADAEPAVPGWRMAVDEVFDIP